MSITNYDNIPEQMRWSRSWLLAGPDENGIMKAPHSFNSRGIFKVDPRDTSKYMDLETVIEASAHYGCGIGFALSDLDTFSCVDLDIKNIHNYPNKIDHKGKAVEWTSEEDIARYHKIINKLDSYTERSTSAQGFHTWVQGDIGAGCKRDGVEVYSRERFIVCTGNVYLNKDIEDRQELLNILVGEIRAAAEADAPKVALTDLEETETDEVILERARTAENSGKFAALFGGDWNGYPSQSEADLALMSMFTFYSKSNVQCRRLFRMSGLGQRDKAQKNDRHLNLMLSMIRGREAKEEERDNLAVEAGKRLVAQLLGSVSNPAPVQAQQYAPAPYQYTPPPALPPLPPVQMYNPVIPPSDQTVIAAGQEWSMAVAEPEDDFEYLPPGVGPQIKFDFDPVLAGLEPRKDEVELPGISWPPGVAGALAQYIFDGAPRPVKEVAIVAAIGLLAGVCGKSFTIPQSGLNVYMVLVAKSAVGKEAMHSGIANMMSYIRDSVPNVTNFVDFTDYASGPALSKAVATNPSFVNVSGEWGRKLRRLGMEDGRDGPMQQLRTVMTNLYQKSGPKSVVGGIGYSDKEKNIASVSGVAYSMIGETTPSTFYDSLTETMMEDGFLSRFTVLEYTGNRPKYNVDAVKAPNTMLLETMCSLVQRAIDLNDRFTTQEVLSDPEAHKILSNFNFECDDHINSSEDEGFRQMWNRAHLKAYRMAALLAVADNHTFPVIQKEHAEWALLLIRKDIGVMSRRINSGDVGVGDSPRERKVLSLIEKFLKEGAPPSYGVPEKMREAAVIPRKYLQICTQKSGSFTSHRLGQSAALDLTLKSLADSGYISLLDKAKAATDFQFHGICYRVITLPRSSQEERDAKIAKQHQ